MTAAKILAERLRDWGSETYELQPLEIPDAMRDMRAAADLIERQAAELAALQAELEVAESALLRKGYRKTCDIAACNCGSQWNHGGHAEQRLSEISEALRGAGFNGGTLLGNVETVCAERDALRADAERLDWLESTMRRYGDGHTEPRECSLFFGWTQGRKDETFPGLRAAIDAAKEQR